MTFLEQREMLAKLSQEIPECDEERTVLLRVLSAALQHQYDVPLELAIRQNPMVKKAMLVGYALAVRDRQAVEKRPDGRWFVTAPVMAA